MAVETLERTTNQRLQGWVDEMAELCSPDHVHWCDGSQREYDELCARMVETGTFIKLNEKLRPNSFLCRSDPADVAHALVGLVGENVGILCGLLAIQNDVERILFGGSTLRGNGPLRELLAVFGHVYHKPIVFLEDGGFAGAVGALEVAAAGSLELANEAP